MLRTFPATGAKRSSFNAAVNFACRRNRRRILAPTGPVYGKSTTIARARSPGTTIACSQAATRRRGQALVPVLPQAPLLTAPAVNSPEPSGTGLRADLSSRNAAPRAGLP